MPFTLLVDLLVDNIRQITLSCNWRFCAAQTAEQLQSCYAKRWRIFIIL